MKYFLKEQVENPLLDRKGKVIPFESLADRIGVIALDDTKDADLIADLESFRKRSVGGVVLLAGVAEYEELKKKLPFQASASPSEQLRVMAPVFQPPKRPESAAADSGIPIDPFAPRVTPEAPLAQRANEPAGAAAFRLRTDKASAVKPRPAPKTPTPTP